MLNLSTGYNDLSNINTRRIKVGNLIKTTNSSPFTANNLINSQSISFKGNFLNNLKKVKVKDAIAAPGKLVNNIFINFPKKLGEEIGTDYGVSFSKKCFNKACMKFADDGFFNTVANPIRDIVACVLYVQASLNNKKIPEERRPFVATLDGVNGITTVLLQVTLGLAAIHPKNIDRVSKFIFGKDPTAVQKGAVNGLAGLVVGAIFAKRVLTYLISTPIACAIKDKFKPKKAGEEKLAGTEIKPSPVKTATTEPKIATSAMLITPKQSTRKPNDIFARFYHKKA